MLLAWFSPLPPVRSGIADCTAELAPALSGEHEVHLFVDEPIARAWTRRAAAAAPLTVRSAHDLVPLQRQRPYDLAVYQMGNSSHHDYAWPYVFRYPGLLVLHDAHLHHARAALLLRERRADDYRVEFARNEPGVHRDAAELAVAGFDSPLLYDWPFVRLAVGASRMTLVHSRLWRDVLRDAMPTARIEHVRLGHGTPLTPEDVDARRRRARARHGIPQDSVVFGVIGGLSPEKRVPQVLDAFAAVLPSAPEARLLLAGSAADHYDLDGDIDRRGLRGSVVVTGYLEGDEALTDAVAASDVTMNLRWPTAREISGPWLRGLAAGRATIIVDLAHLADVPALDPRTWTVPQGDSRSPVTVAIDIVDEDHSLRLAMRRLVQDGALRARLGDAGREYWAANHSQGAMLEDYRGALNTAAGLPPPAIALPPHMTHAHQASLHAILDGLGVAVPWSNM